MFETHLKPSQLSSPVAGEATVSDEVLAEATRILAAQSFMGLVWLDPQLVAVTCFGSLAAFVPLDRRVSETVTPLIGLDDTLLALKSGGELSFALPNVALVGREGSSPRLDLQVYWLPDRDQFLLTMSKVLSAGELEIGLAQQVRKRMIAEAELAQKSKALATSNAELTRANRDLAEFAYVISHDLKAPLRALRYYADELEQSLAAETEGDPRVHAAQIRRQSRRMTQMLTDLLAYSKIGRQEEALETIDSADLVRGIVDAIAHPPGIAIEISGDWPIFETYVAPLDLVIRNLIGNAVAHHDRTEGHIRVSATLVRDTLDIAIADDGPGIPTEWHEAVFLPFRTIAERPADDSSGIGLALVRRTAESVGATLTLSSDPSIARGTTFKIAWPLKTIA